MIRAETEYKNAEERLEQEKETLQRQRGELEEMDLSEEEVERALGPLISFRDHPASGEKQLPEEIGNLLKKWGGEAPPQEFRHVILRLYQWSSLSAMETAQYVGRNRRYLMRNYASTLVEEGALKRRRPDAPGSPN